MYEAKYHRKWLKKNPEYMREWRKKNKEKILEYHKQWEKEHPGYMVEHIKASRNKKPEYYREYKREYARVKRLEKKVEIEVKEMKYRNRGKHSFKRLKRQNQVLEYCKTKIKQGISFSVDDITKDLGIPRSTVVELLHELEEKKTYGLIYNRGYIEIKDLGNNGNGFRAKQVEGLKVKKMGNNMLKKLQKKANIYGHLQTLTKEGYAIPPMKKLMKELKELYGITDCQGNICKLLQELDQEDKIIYKNGKVLAVNVKDIKSDTGKTLTYVKQEKTKEPSVLVQSDALQSTVDPTIIAKAFNIPTFTETDNYIAFEGSLTNKPVDSNELVLDNVNIIGVPKQEISMSDLQLETQIQNFDKAVKELVADYITNANISTRDEMVEYIDAIFKITDKLKNKLY